MKIPSWLTSKLIGVLALILIITAIVISLLPQVQPQKEKTKQGFKGSTVLDTSKNGMFPFTTDPINSLDQYELDAVFQNEGDRELRKQQINDMTRRYPLDWVKYPPNASKFQSGQAKYIEGFSTESSAEVMDVQYKNIGEGNLVPPDTLAMEKEEKRILAAYAPKKTSDLTKYDIDDANTLITNLYKPKGLIPTVVQRDNTVFEVVSTRNVNEKIEYEDDLPVAPLSSTEVGEATIYGPPAATQNAAGLDPFYEPNTKTRSDRSDYTKWTPGLERMFAPTYPQQDWINGDSH